jgi:hypothetical protein
VAAFLSFRVAACRRLAPLLPVLLVIVVGACDRRLERVPDALLGRWETEAPAYRDRALELRPDRVIFHTSDHSVAVHFVVGVSVDDRSGGGRLYTIAYEDDTGDEQPWTLRILASGDPPRQLQIENRKEVWKRVAASG